VPDHADELSALNVKVNSFERLDFLRPASVGADQAFGLDRGLDGAG
jgi:hypothetical protein